MRIETLFFLFGYVTRDLSNKGRYEGEDESATDDIKKSQES